MILINDVDLDLLESALWETSWSRIRLEDTDLGQKTQNWSKKC